IFGIQVDIFGHILGKLLGVIYVVYFGLVLVSVLATYIQVVQLFLYPTFPTYLLCILILLLILYAVIGGLRVIVGVGFVCFFYIFTLCFDSSVYSLLSYWGDQGYCRCCILVLFI